MQAEADHIREIEAVARGAAAAGRDPVVAASWRRCLDKHRLDPAQRRRAHILTSERLKEHRQRAEALIAVARAELEPLYRLVADEAYVLLLSDAQGVTVEFMGRSTDATGLRRAGLYLGAEWLEAHAGTCAVGACLESGEALTVHASDHFDVTHGGLSCSAAPVFDSAGRLAAVLDLSHPAATGPRRAQSLTLAMVRRAARRIELACLERESRRDRVLRLTGTPELEDGAALALDGGGHVIRMTHAAARLMAQRLGTDWRDGAALLGRHVSEIFEIAPDGLERLAASGGPRPILTGDGVPVLAALCEPRPLPAAVTRPRPLPAGLRALAGSDPQMQAVIARAAALAPTRMALAIDGENGSGKTALARAIHAAGGRGPLVSLACQGFAAEEAALIFGHAGRSASEGLIAAAEGGTLVLDNLDELPAALQARMTALLAEGRYRPVGAALEREARLRVIATFAGDPAAAVAAGRLRRDLWARLAGTRLSLPPLRARRDLFALAEAALSRAFGRPVALEAGALPLLTAHDWPGNLHELDQLARLTAAGRNPACEEVLHIGAADLPMTRDAARPHPGTAQAALLLHRLEETGWNISETARRMGVDRSTLHRQIRRHGLRHP